MSRLENRVMRLERDGGRNGWRAYAGVPLVEWPDAMLEAYLAESEGWPADYTPTDEELRAMAMLTGPLDEDEDAA